MHLPDPTFPPLLSGHAVKAPERAFESACAAAGFGDAGAGDVFWARDTAQMDWAIVLEPEVSAAQAQQMLILGQAAFADAFGAVAPPEVGVHFRWPGTVLINGAKAGIARICMGSDLEDGCPAWMVIGLSINIRRKGGTDEPGDVPDETDLMEEGCGDVDRTQLVESLSRHFMNRVHEWHEDGFRPAHETWTSKAENAGEEVELNWSGEKRAGTLLTIDDEGNLILKNDTQTIALALDEYVEHPEARQ
ncbi:MAG: biotin/lipoate--protein ligase family protein [Hyphomicrobiales bacterium]